VVALVGDLHELDGDLWVLVLERRLHRSIDRRLLALTRYLDGDGHRPARIRSRSGAAGPDEGQAQ
jgi:hypothetical protein